MWVDLDASTVQDPCDEQEAVATGRILLAAHDGHSRALRPLDEPGQPGLERWTVRQTSVEHMPIGVVELVTIRFPAEFFPEEQIPDISSVQLSLREHAA